jgi:hypothetical protein
MVNREGRNRPILSIDRRVLVVPFRPWGLEGNIDTGHWVNVDWLVRGSQRSPIPDHETGLITELGFTLVRWFCRNFDRSGTGSMFVLSGCGGSMCAIS